MTSCNDRNCDKDQESDDDQKPHNSGCCKSESEKTIELSGHHLVENVQTILVAFCSSSDLKVSAKECVINSVQLEGKV